MSICNPNNVTDACSYVTNNSSCILKGGFINYYQWQYCAFSNRGVPTFLMICWLVVLFFTIAITADSFFAPCLVVVSKVFRMSENLAGVTLLALANGSPDLFSALSAISSGDIGMAIGSVFGAGILVNTITAGIIMIVKPFKVSKRPVLKDLSFYLLGQLWCLVILIRKKVELWTSLVLISIYVVYVFVTVLSRLLYVKQKKGKISNISENPPTQNIDAVATTHIKRFDAILNLSKRDIEEVHDCCNNELHPSFLHDVHCTNGRIKSFCSKNNSLDPHRQESTLSFRSSGRKIVLKRVGSTSHRDPGVLAKLVIENEQEKLSNKRETEIINTTEEKKKIPQFSRENSVHFLKGNIISNITIVKEEDNPPSPVLLNKSRNIIPTITFTSERSESKCPSINNVAVSENDVEGYYTEFPGMIKHFLLTIFPIDLENWSEQSILGKIQSVIQSPIVFVLTLTIPVVDETAFMRGWCKIMNVMHCVFSLIISIVFIKVSMTTFGSSNFYLIYLILIFGSVLSIIVWVTSKADKPPIFHNCYAFLGFVISIIWIYEVANEIVNLLQVFGIVFSISSTILGLTVLALANSIGDMVSNITLAKKNFPQIGYSACIGGPLFNLLIGIGLPFTLKTASVGTVAMNVTSQTTVLISTLMLVTIMNLIALPMQKFRVRQLYGIILIIIYILFIILVILFSLGIISVQV